MSPQEFILMTVPFSDGDPSKHPENTSPPPQVTDEDTYDYYRPIEEGEAKDIHWRIKVASFLTEKFISEEVREGKEYIMETFPEGYKLFEHTKRKAGEIRTDTYLFGYPGGSKFRSPAEFAPHIAWLAAMDPKGETLDGADQLKQDGCSCRFCGALR